MKEKLKRSIKVKIGNNAIHSHISPQISPLHLFNCGKISLKV